MRLFPQMPSEALLSPQEGIGVGVNGNVHPDGTKGLLGATGATLAIPEDTFHVPTMFKRSAEGEHLVIAEFTEGCEWCLTELSLVSLNIKLDGTLCRIKNSLFYKKLSTGLVRVDPDNTADEYLCAAKRNAERTYPLPDGYYTAYGPKINGNPQGADDHYMIRIAPVDVSLMVGFVATDIKRGFGISIDEFYNSVKQTLLESTVQGFIFMWEKPIMRPYKMAQITRRDFGFNWPIEEKVSEDAQMVTMY